VWLSKRSAPDAEVVDVPVRYTFGNVDVAHPETVVAIDQDTLCGFATIGASRHADQPQSGELYAIYVDPPYLGPRNRTRSVE
jgi:hypothetical protein